MVHDALRRISYVPTNPPLESGPLGPPEGVFGQSLLPDVLALDEHVIEETSQLLTNEEHHFQRRESEIEQLVQGEGQLKMRAEEHKKQAEARVRELRTELMAHSRQEIVEAYEALCVAEREYERHAELSQHLHTQLEFARRAHHLAATARDTLHRCVRVAPDAVDPPLLAQSSSDLHDAYREAMAAASASLVAPAALPVPASPRFLPPQIEAPDAARAPFDLEALLVAREHDRRLLARRLSERLIDPFSNALLGIEQCQRVLNLAASSPAIQILNEVDQRLHAVLNDMQVFKFELEPAELEELGLAAMLQRYARYLVASRGVNITTAISGAECRYPPRVERGIFRIARGALENALRHSHAGAIHLALHQRTYRAILTVADTGIGFVVDPTLAAAQSDPQSGLSQMMLETDLLGGKLGVESGPGRGTSIDFVLDLEADKALT